MKTRLFNLWYSISSSFWFIPVLMAIGAVGLSFSVVKIDAELTSEIRSGVAWIYTGGAEGARAVLLAISSSMIGVTGVVFSITIVALSLASGQFGPRLLNNFMRDKGNQVVLGTFIATFTYCLLVLRTVRGLDDDSFVPHLSVTLGIVLALLSIGVLIYFIHHVSTSIQVMNLIAAVGEDLDNLIDRLFPEKIGDSGNKIIKKEPSAAILPYEEKMIPVYAKSTGYVQAIDYEGLMKLASEKNFILQIEYYAGMFVVKGDVIVTVFPPEKLRDEYIDEINDAFILGKNRTLEQDCEFAVEQLAEISVRALSAGINDPFTAMQCVDRLSASLCDLVERKFPSPYHYDQENQVRLITKKFSFESILNSSFNTIRQYAREHVGVAHHLMESLERLARRVHRHEDMDSILRQAIMIERGSQEGLSEEFDRQKVEEQYKHVIQIVEKRRAELA